MDIFIVIGGKTTEREMNKKLTLEEEYSLICEEKFKNQDCSSKEDIVSVLSLILGEYILSWDSSCILMDLKKIIIEKIHPLKLKKSKKENLIDMLFYYLNHSQEEETKRKSGNPNSLIHRSLLYENLMS